MAKRKMSSVLEKLGFEKWEVEILETKDYKRLLYNASLSELSAMHEKIAGVPALGQLLEDIKAAYNDIFFDQMDPSMEIVAIIAGATKVGIVVQVDQEKLKEKFREFESGVLVEIIESADFENLDYVGEVAIAVIIDRLPEMKRGELVKLYNEIPAETIHDEFMDAINNALINKLASLPVQELFSARNEIEGRDILRRIDDLMVAKKAEISIDQALEFLGDFPEESAGSDLGNLLLDITKDGLSTLLTEKLLELYLLAEKFDFLPELTNELKNRLADLGERELVEFWEMVGDDRETRSAILESVVKDCNASK